MKQQIGIAACLMVLAMAALPSYAMAQGKTVSACREEWRANKAANKANGVTEKAYVAECHSGAPPAQTTVAPAAPAPGPTAAAPKINPAPTATGEKTAKECREKWRANKAANKVNGITEKAYVAQCHSGAAPAQTTAAPAAPPTPAPASPAATTSARPAAAPAPVAVGNAVFPSAVSSKYSSESAGKARFHTCLDQYRINKTNGGNGGLKWIEKGDGYYSECNRRLKGQT